MTMNELVSASARGYTDSAFNTPEYNKMRVMAMVASGEKPRRAYRKSFVLAVLAAVLALALSVTAIAAASGAIRLPALERLFGLEPAAQEQDREAMAACLYEQIEGWNWKRAEQNRQGAGYDLGDPEVITAAYRAGLLDAADVYEMFGMTSPSDADMAAALARFPELEADERELRAGQERFAKLTGRTAAGETLSPYDEAFVLKYTALRQKTLEMRRGLAQELTRLQRYEDDPALWPESLPKNYRYTAPDVELMSDREKAQELLASSKPGEGWYCWILSMDRTADGYKVTAAFAQAVTDDDGARLCDEDGNVIFTFAAAGAYRPSDLEAESFMTRLPKWSVVLKKSEADVKTSTGLVKHYYGDNTFAVTSMRRMRLLNPGNEFLYRSSYEYVEPLGDRDANGALAQPYYPEKLELGECCYDGQFANTAPLYDFVDEYAAGGAPVLTVYTPTGTMVFDASDPASLRITETVFDFDSGTVTATIRRPTDFTIKDDVFTIHFGNEAEDYSLEREPEIIVN